MNRPSHKEINRKIKQAKEAVSENQFSILNPVIIAADAIELGVDLRHISFILIDLLSGFRKSDYLLGCSRMPRCKAPEILGNEAYLHVRRNDEG